MKKFCCGSAVLFLNLYQMQYSECQTALSDISLAAKNINVTYSEDEMNAFDELITNQLT